MAGNLGRGSLIGVISQKAKQSIRAPSGSPMWSYAPSRRPAGREARAGACDAVAHPVPAAPRGRDPRGRGTPPGPTVDLLLPVGVEEIAEQHPALPVELRQLLLLDGREVHRARVDPDAGQEERQLEVLHVRRLLHDVLAG